MLECLSLSIILLYIKYIKGFQANLINYNNIAILLGKEYIFFVKHLKAHIKIKL
jgi:hypothetical protein